jgi:NAD(P)-dependent dehydrogenase (short-subunit alcohol dehydrogenase family)
MMIQMAAKLMKKRGGGAIINIASIAGIKPSIHEMAYSATKAGVISLTKGFAKELGPEIRVNCIAPGLIQTRLSAGLVDDKEKVAEFIKRYPLKRLGYPNDIAPAVVFLASDASSFMTGAVMVIDGGTMA